MFDAICEYVEREEKREASCKTAFVLGTNIKRRTYSFTGVEQLIEDFIAAVAAKP